MKIGSVIHYHYLVMVLWWQLLYVITTHHPLLWGVELEFPRTIETIARIDISGYSDGMALLF